MIPASEINSFQPNFSIYQEPEARKKVSFSALIIRKSDKLSKNTQEELIVILEASFQTNTSSPLERRLDHSLSHI